MHARQSTFIVHQYVDCGNLEPIHIVIYDCGVETTAWLAGMW